MIPLTLLAASPDATVPTTLSQMLRAHHVRSSSSKIFEMLSSDDDGVVLVTTGTCTCVGMAGSPDSQVTVWVPSVSVTLIVPGSPAGNVQSAVRITVLGGLVDAVSVLTVMPCLAPAATILGLAASATVCSVVVGSKTAAIASGGWGGGRVPEERHRTTGYVLGGISSRARLIAWSKLSAMPRA